MRWLSDSDLRRALGPWVATRAAVLLVGYVAVLSIGFQMETANRFSGNELLNLQSRWDAGWYLGIAMHGYDYYPDQADTTQSVVFFPAYPATVGLLGRVFGGGRLAFVLAGTLVSMLAFLAALAYLIRLARELLGSSERAAWAAWFLAAYPFAVFYGAVYTESMFLLAAIGAVYHTRRGDLAWAGLWGLVAGLTRPNGCLLTLPLLLLVLERRSSSVSSGPGRAGGGRNTLRLAVSVTPCVGLVAYASFVWWLTGDPLTWATGQRAWGRTYDGLATVVKQFEWVSQLGLKGFVLQLPHEALGSALVLGSIALAWPVARRLGIGYAAYIVVNLMPVLLSGSLMSMGRFSSVFFPIFIWLAAVVPERHAPVLVTFLMSLQTLGAVLFYTWRPFY
jgi:hypothetical protein